MDLTYYLAIFNDAAAQLNKELLKKMQIKLAVGIYLESVCIKLYKLTWANKSDNPLLSQSRIFFSIWINNATMNKHKLFYNIHALKLRQLKGYNITSRDFASDFRTRFKPYENSWPNVSTQFGPLTLMEGFLYVDLESFQDEITGLANKFFDIVYLIDDLLDERKI